MLSVLQSKRGLFTGLAGTMKVSLPSVFCLLIAVFSAGPPLSGQDQGSAPAGQSTGVLALAEEVESKIAEIQQGPGEDDPAQQAQLELYEEASGFLEEAKRFREQALQFDTSLREGPAIAEGYREELKSLEITDLPREVENLLGAEASTQEVDSALARENASLATLQTRLAELETELSTIRERTVRIGERQLTAATELNSVKEAPVQAPDTPNAEARQIRREALRLRLEAELAMLEREAASEAIRAAVAEAGRDLTGRQIQLSQEKIAVLQETATRMVSDSLRSVKEAAEKVRERVSDLPEPLAGLLTEVEDLSEDTAAVTALITESEQQVNVRREELDHYRASLEDMKRMSQISRGDDSFGIELVRQLNRLPSSRENQRQISETSAVLAGTRVDQFAFERALRSGATDETTGEAKRAAVPLGLENEVEALVSQKEGLREDLQTGYKRLISVLTDQLYAEQQIEAVTGEFRSFAEERTILIRTASPLTLESLRSLPASLRELYGHSRLSEVLKYLGAAALLLWLIPALAVGILLLLRPFAAKVLQTTNLQTRRISTDHYRHTISALGVTLLLTLPLPVALAGFGLVLIHYGGTTHWVFSLGGGLIGLSLYLFGLLFLVSICRPNGVAERHFQWDTRITGRLRRLSWWWLGLSFPCFLTWTLVFGQREVMHLNDVGRLTGMALAIAFGVVFGRLLHPKKGVAAVVHERAPELYFGRLRMVWFVLIITFSVCVTVLLSIGYLFTGLILLEKILATVTAVVTVFLGYALVIRWFNIRERRIVAEERLAEQKARSEKRQSLEVIGVEHNDEAALVEITEEEPPDMAEVEAQTRNLVGFLSTVFLIWWLASIWSGFSPAMRVIDGFSVLWGLSLTDLGLILLVIIGVVATLRNLPGLLEVLILRRLGLDAGTRTAINTLAQYAVIAAGVAFLFPAIGADWSSFGWIAAALSVGLGFGLQEVVANFVCGIILLFERPVRVGDVVTVDGIDGTVTKIQIRATTITNWDRKDFIVPNKQFVTGTLMNWTLSGGLNRIVIPVGVAYGSDTEKVRNLLLKVIEDHSALLEDPAPLVTFEGFGESSLDFVVRGYLPSLEGRLGIIHELHTQIYQELNREGIEIPFPQRDLHIRSHPPESES